MDIIKSLVLEGTVKNIKLPLNIRDGYKGYDVILKKDNILSKATKKNYLKIVYNLCSKNLKIILFIVCCLMQLKSNRSFSILPRSLFITKQSPIKILIKILLRNMLILESKYDLYSDYSMVVKGRKWLSKKVLLSDIKKNMINKNINNDCLDLDNKYE